MALKQSIVIPLFSPPNSASECIRPDTRIRFSNWNNANAQKFIIRRRTIREVLDEIQFEKRFSAALKLADMDRDSDSKSTVTPIPIPTDTPRFKSRGTPSVPSRPSIRSKFCKYTKPPRRIIFTRRLFFPPVLSLNSSHPAGESGTSVLANSKIRVSEQKVIGEYGDFNLHENNVTESRTNVSEIGASELSNTKIRVSDGVMDEDGTSSSNENISTGVRIHVGEHGVSYIVPGAPFEFQHSYTETPKVKPLEIREKFSPFGPETMERPWVGIPCPKKKKRRDYNFSSMPPSYVDRAEPVHPPRQSFPLVPQIVRSREEILGEPLNEQELILLRRQCMQVNKQLNIGRDGLTHNMLESIHICWKRMETCRIWCMGVCTVDMDNVCRQLEDKTGGKIIYRSGGLIYLFRGRNYDSWNRPRFPRMLWRPVSPLYPRLIEKVPDGLTLEEVSKMRQRARSLTPITKIERHGVHCHLVELVREAFEECDLVRIDCPGVLRSDYKKIGGKLKDLVPCVLISFPKEQIILWRGREWKPLLLPTKDESGGVHKHEIDGTKEDENRYLKHTHNHSLVAMGELLKKAIGTRSAMVLEKPDLDADIVRKKAVLLAKYAPPGPIFVPESSMAISETQDSRDEILLPPCDPKPKRRVWKHKWKRP